MASVCHVLDSSLLPSILIPEEHISARSFQSRLIVVTDASGSNGYLAAQLDMVLIFQRFIPVLCTGLIRLTADSYPTYWVYLNAGNVIVFVKGLRPPQLHGQGSSVWCTRAVGIPFICVHLDVYWHHASHRPLRHRLFKLGPSEGQTNTINTYWTMKAKFTLDLPRASHRLTQCIRTCPFSRILSLTPFETPIWNLHDLDQNLDGCRRHDTRNLYISFVKKWCEDYRQPAEPALSWVANRNHLYLCELSSSIHELTARTMFGSEHFFNFRRVLCR